MLLPQSSGSGFDWSAKRTRRGVVHPTDLGESGGSYLLLFFPNNAFNGSLTLVYLSRRLAGVLVRQVVLETNNPLPRSGGGLGTKRPPSAEAESPTLSSLRTIRPAGVGTLRLMRPQVAGLHRASPSAALDKSTRICYFARYYHRVARRVNYGLRVESVKRKRVGAGWPCCRRAWMRPV